MNKFDDALAALSEITSKADTLESLIVNPQNRSYYSFSLLREQMLDLIGHWAVSNKLAGSASDKALAASIIQEFKTKYMKPEV